MTTAVETALKAASEARKARDETYEAKEKAHDELSQAQKAKREMRHAQIMRGEAPEPPDFTDWSIKVKEIRSGKRTDDLSLAWKNYLDKADIAWEARQVYERAYHDLVVVLIDAGQAPITGNTIPQEACELARQACQSDARADQRQHQAKADLKSAESQARDATLTRIRAMAQLLEAFGAMDQCGQV